MALDLDQIRATAQRVAASHGLDVVEIEYQGDSKHRILRVFIEKNAEQRVKLAEAAKTAGPEAAPPSGVEIDQLAGITHEDCQQFSRDFGTVLDVEELVPGADYTLEVSSPGFDRILRTREHFERFSGERIAAELKLPIDGRRRFIGVLKSVAPDTIVVEVDGKAHSLPLDRIQKARLRPE